MNSNLVFCFSGQGSQYFQMGRELFWQNKIFSNTMNQLDEIAKSILNESVLSVLYNKQAKLSESFDEIIYTHPAIFMFEYSLFQILVEKAIFPQIVLGASLGEYSCFAISGIMGYEEILKMIINQAQMIKNNCKKAGMMAILFDVEYFSEIKSNWPDLEIASINSSNHFVVSGSLESLCQLEETAKKKEFIIHRLPVSYAFHSKMIDSASSHFLKYLKKDVFKNPNVRYWSCLAGKEIRSSNDVSNSFLWDVCRNPILLNNTIKDLESNGSWLYLDIGPSGTIANLTKMNLSIDSKSEVRPIISPFGKDISNLERTIELIQGKQKS